MNGRPLWSCSFPPSAHAASLPLQLLPQHEGVMHLILPTAWKGAGESPPPRKDGSGKRILVLKGWVQQKP